MRYSSELSEIQAFGKQSLPIACERIFRHLGHARCGVFGPRLEPRSKFQMFSNSTFGRQRATCIKDKAPICAAGFRQPKISFQIIDGGRRTASSTQYMIHENQGRRAYKLKEAASLLGVSTVSLRRAISRGLIKPSRAFRHVIIASEELDRFLRATSSLGEGGKQP